MTEAKQPARKRQSSTLYIISSATVAALILGLALFLFIRGFQWRAALADFRAEPGIEILSVERVGFFKKRLRGLRDPLAPTAESYLRKHHIGEHAAEVILTEFHSLNTPYALQREEERATEIKDIRDELIATVGAFAEELKLQREEDMEKFTRMLFEARFPEEMKTVEIRWQDSHWVVEGELYSPERIAFIEESPDYVIEGELDFSGLVNLTETKMQSLRSDIESTNLLVEDLDGNLVHLERVRRLLLDFDSVCKRSEEPLPTLQLVYSDLEIEQRALIRDTLSEENSIEERRFLPDSSSGSIPEGKSAAHLKLVLSSQP
ncbi:MAG: hypothetical protein AAF733_10785 [Verrucomicrobiota bacterium]